MTYAEVTIETASEDEIHAALKQAEEKGQAISGYAINPAADATAAASETATEQVLHYVIPIKSAAEQIRCYRLKSVLGVAYAIVAVAGLIPKILVITADSFPELFQGESGMTWDKVLALPTTMKALSITGGALGTLSIIPFVAKKGYQFILNLSIARFVMAIFGASGMSSVASGSRRAWLELGASDLMGNIAITFGFLTGMTTVEDVIHQAKFLLPHDLRQLKRLGRRIHNCFFAPPPSLPITELSVEEKRREILYWLDDQGVAGQFSNDNILKSWNSHIEKMMNGENLYEKFSSLMQEGKHQIPGWQRALKASGDYILAPTISGLVNVNTWTYAVSLFTYLFDFIGIETLTLIASRAFAVTGTITSALFVWFAAREHLIAPLMRFVSKEFSSSSTWKQFIFNLLLGIPAICVGLSNFALARDNPELAKTTGTIVGLALIAHVTAVTTKGFTAWLLSSKCMHNSNLMDQGAKFKELLEALKSAVKELPNDVVNNLYDQLVKAKAKAEAETLMIVSTAKEADEETSLLPAAARA